MSRSVGIDVGDFAVKTVEVDGSYRKARLLACRIERVPEGAVDTDARVATAAAVVAQCLQDGRMTGDKVLGQACREAVLRTIEVPFRGADSIRKVIKSEVESAIHSHAVDDMVVDFHEIGGAAEGSRVLVAAVPKPALRRMLGALDAEGVEPERVDLDTMALFRVADWCGAFRPAGAAPPPEEGSAGDEDSAGDAPAVPAPALPAVAGDTTGNAVTVVLDLGAKSTRILLVEGSRLVDMRTLRLGDAMIAEAVARAHDVPFATAREAVVACLTSGRDYQTEVGGGDGDPAGEEGGAVPAVPAVAVRRVLIEAADVVNEQAAFLQRLARELVRFLASSGLQGTIAQVWITGGASRRAGIDEMLREVFGVAPRTLDVLGQLKHSLTSEEVEEFGPQVAVATGLALANLGGPAGYDFRREDLAYTRGFDRVKSALAITCMLALFAAIVFGVKLNNQLKNIEYRIGLTYEAADADPRKPKFFGQLYQVLRLNPVQDPRYFQFEEGNKKQYGFKDLLADLVTKPVPERIKFVREKMRRALDLKQKESGIYEEVSLESGLAVLVRFADVLTKAEPAMGKYLLASLELNMRSTGSSSGHSGRFLQVRLAFRGSDFRERFAVLRSAVDEECGLPDSPFEAIDDRVGGDRPFRDGDAKGINGAYYDLKIHIRESFAPIGFDK